MTKSIKILSIAFLLLSGKAFSQNGEPKPNKWAVEAEFVQPFLPTINIIRIQATRTLTPETSKKRGDLIIGAYIRPNVKHDVVEKINEYMFVLGYRQYLWKGLHLEAKSNMGYAWGTKNLEDGKDYETPTWFWESNIGYKFNLSKGGLYVIPQFGTIGNLVADIGPRGGKPDTFIQGNLLLGFKF
jgi:hypothetical protein